ncbi:hypothetical protein NCAS_0C00990 [Naumovozyma castellii]|uniref:Uncharacterized protein n=1 Tax=Naumovozyma castellii TaxID=27288 RepID=G0VC80_NAUCA|nr:hypothetical protein NCAS_0C00990 [Naumovozyma castellii CBS 4309]CCC69089.1 hypothetical protein NCAS_0C00990 [Naumovozyma castellii CBS 4309]
MTVESCPSQLFDSFRGPNFFIFCSLEDRKRELNSKIKQLLNNTKTRSFESYDDYFMNNYMLYENVSDSDSDIEENKEIWHSSNTAQHENHEWIPQDIYEIAPKNRVTAGLSISSIIPEDKRRSRATQQQEITAEEMKAKRRILNAAKIRNLKSSVVPKVRKPFRMSDWLLQENMKYRSATENDLVPVVSRVSVEELESSDRMQQLLAKFK